MKIFSSDDGEIYLTQNVFSRESVVESWNIKDLFSELGEPTIVTAAHTACRSTVRNITVIYYCIHIHPVNF